jgi:DNA-binding transcriptional regulator YdaS (Cro superfamily)
MSPIEKAVKIIGSQTALAKHFEIEPQAVQQWISSGRVPTKRVLGIEALTNGEVSRHELRPDIYPEDKNTPKAA